mmetsp:Transcript_15078/g.24397  ORF Transcript_15078/g.24397 Transcript_15078/m.24397 type:complete len:468 (+) Transcript_15078:168-1571(+)
MSSCSIDMKQYENTRKLPKPVAALAARHIRNKLEESMVVDCLHSSSTTIATAILPEDDASSSSSSSSLEQMQTPIVSLDQFELGSCLGQGSFSSVFSVQKYIKEPTQDSEESQVPLTVDSGKVVIKMLQPKLLDNPTLFSNCAVGIVREGLILTALNHQNIVRVRAWSASDGENYATGRHDAFFLVMDRLELTLKHRITEWQIAEETAQEEAGKSARGGSLKLSFRSSRRCPIKGPQPQERLDIVRQLAEAVSYLHSKGIIHRDLKPDNIGFDAEGTLKVFDFDLARMVPDTCTRNQNEEKTHDALFRMTRKMGSPRYMCPNIARGMAYNLKSDVYSFALLCHEVLTLERPYTEIPRGMFQSQVYHSGYRPEVPLSWPHSMNLLLESCWHHSIHRRPSMDSVCQILDGTVVPYFSSKIKTKADPSSPSPKTETRNPGSSFFPKLLRRKQRNPSQDSNSGIRLVQATS